jgi:hypothetical protein
MNAPIALAHEFVKSIPGKLEERTLYVYGVRDRHA